MHHQKRLIISIKYITSKKSVADRPHGDNQQNKLFKEKFGLMTMMLHALELQFTHPITGMHVRITADLQDEFIRMIKVLGFDCNFLLKK